MATQTNMEKYYAPKDQPVFLLDCQAAFEKLTPQEKQYAHYISVASWYGSLTCLHQTSVESPAIFAIFQKLFHAQSIDELSQASEKNGVSKEGFHNFVQYAATFYGNMGNYLSFGDTKFVPRCSESEFQKILESTSAPQETKNTIGSLFNEYKGRIFSLEPSQLELAMPGKGITTYYSPNITSEDVALVRQFMTEQNISPYNTRLFKTGEKEYELRLASAQKKSPSTHKFQEATIHVAYGDHSAYMAKVAENLAKAKQYAANDKQANMLAKYVDSFTGGSIEDHKDSQRWWIQDIGPAVETNIGFIESYRDPEGERGEFEGFVAVVNKEMSKKFANLVTNAEQFIAELPWPKEYEKDKFLKPDFTSLEVLTYASSGVPAGINIPNYDDIRQTQGFKNVSLGNVIAAKSNDKIDFILDEDQVYFQKYDIKSFEVQVGIHELLGHGTGKLLMEDAQGVKNFDSNLINPITNAPVTSWYKPKETYDSLFQSYGSTIEECRAESCGLYLCSNPELLKQFGITDPKEQEDVYYANWLGMILKGFKGVEFYTPATQKWGQAHSQARYVILRVLLEAGEGLVTIKVVDDTAFLVLDRSKILTVGQKAIGTFLKKLQIYKATADVKGAIAFYGEYSKVPEEFLKYRDIVLFKQKPRRVFVQGHTYIENGEVKQKVFEASPKGVIESMVTRFSADDVQLYY